MSKWIEPFGFTKDEADAFYIGGNTEVVILLTLFALDIVTLPLAVFWIAGVSRNDSA